MYPAGLPDQAASSKQRLNRATFRLALIDSLRALRPLAMKLTGSPADAEDLLQATCLRALESEDRLQDHSNLAGWLCRIMRNLQIDSFRSRARRTSLAERHLAAVAPEGIATWRLIGDEDLSRVLPTLSAHFQAVWRLHHDDGLDQNEIAVRLGIPRATVATRIFRARLALRQALLQNLGEARSLDDDGDSEDLPEPPIVKRLRRTSRVALTPSPTPTAIPRLAKPQRSDRARAPGPPIVHTAAVHHLPRPATVVPRNPTSACR